MKLEPICPDWSPLEVSFKFFNEHLSPSFWVLQTGGCYDEVSNCIDQGGDPGHC